MSNEEQIPYQFAIVRYVHNIPAGEFVNIGIVMFVPGKNSVVTYMLSRQTERMQAFWPGIDYGYDALFDALDSRAYHVAGFGATPGVYKTARGAFRAILPKDSSCFQLSPIMSGISPNPKKRLSELYEDFVIRHNT